MDQIVKWKSCLLSWKINGDTWVGNDKIKQFSELSIQCLKKAPTYVALLLTLNNRKLR